MARQVTWQGFEARLAQSLGLMPVGSYLIVEQRGLPGQDGSWFVQFARVREGLLAEAVSNLYLGKVPRLSPVQEAALIGLGWSVPRPRGKQHRNWQREFDVPVANGDAAALAVRTLREVHGLAAPADLAYKRFLGKGGGDLPDPGLGLAETGEARTSGSVASFDQLVGPVLRGLEVGTVDHLEPGSWLVRAAPAPFRVVRLDTEPPILRAYQAFCDDVVPSAGLLEHVNDVNAKLLVGRVLWVDRVLLVSLEATADALTTSLVQRTCNEVLTLARRCAGEFCEAAVMPPLPAGAGLLVN